MQVKTLIDFFTTLNDGNTIKYLEYSNLIKKDVTRKIIKVETEFGYVKDDIYSGIQVYFEDEKVPITFDFGHRKKKISVFNEEVGEMIETNVWLIESFIFKSMEDNLYHAISTNERLQTINKSQIKEILRVQRDFYNANNVILSPIKHFLEDDSCMCKVCRK